MVLFTDIGHVEKGISKCRKNLKKRDKLSLFLIDEECGMDTLIRAVGGDISLIGEINRISKSATNQASVIAMLIKGLPLDTPLCFCFDIELEHEIISVLVDVYHDTSFCRWEKKKDLVPQKEPEAVKAPRKQKKPEISVSKEAPLADSKKQSKPAVKEKKPEVLKESGSHRKSRIKVTDDVIQAVLEGYKNGLTYLQICQKYNISKSAYYNIVRNVPKNEPKVFLADENLIRDLSDGMLTKTEVFQKYDLTPHTYSLTLCEMKKRGLEAKICPERTNLSEEVDDLFVGAASIQSDIRIRDEEIMLSLNGVKYLWNVEVNEEIRRLFSKYAFDMDDQKVLKIEKIFKYYEIKQRDPFGGLMEEENKELEKHHFKDLLKNNGLVFPENVFLDLYELFWYFKDLEFIRGGGYEFER